MIQADNSNANYYDNEDDADDDDGDTDGNFQTNIPYTIKE